LRLLQVPDLQKLVILVIFP
jgi:hypothetical protein